MKEKIRRILGLDHKRDLVGWEMIAKDEKVVRDIEKAIARKDERSLRGWLKAWAKEDAREQRRWEKEMAKY